MQTEICPEQALYGGDMEEVLGWHGAEQYFHPSLPAVPPALGGSVCHHCPSDTAGINHAWAAETVGNAPPLTPTLTSIPVMPGVAEGKA